MLPQDIRSSIWRAARFQHAKAVTSRFLTVAPRSKAVAWWMNGSILCLQVLIRITANKLISLCKFLPHFHDADFDYAVQKDSSTVRVVLTATPDDEGVQVYLDSHTVHTRILHRGGEWWMTHENGRLAIHSQPIQ